MNELDLLLSTLFNVGDHAELRGPRFWGLTQSLDVATLIIDRENLIELANEPAHRLLALSERDTARRRMCEFLGEPGQVFLDSVRQETDDPYASFFRSYLVDQTGAANQVAVFAYAMHRDSLVTGGMLLFIVPGHREAALLHALANAGSRDDFVANFLRLAREDERKRIASDLHDGLGQVLTMLKFKVERALLRLDSADVDGSRLLLNEAVRDLRGAVDDVRRISNQLRPTMLDDLGLLRTVQSLCRQCQAATPQLAIELDVPESESDLPPTLKYVVFRLLQEALNNVIKHSQASRVLIYMRIHDGQFSIGVEDNGQGFDSRGILSGKTCLVGIGLNSMRERTEGASGRFSIQSEPGQGTVITASWMLNASGSMHRAMQEQVMQITASPPAIQPDINLNEQSPSVRR